MHMHHVLAVSAKRGKPSKIRETGVISKIKLNPNTQHDRSTAVIVFPACPTILSIDHQGDFSFDKVKNREVVLVSSCIITTPSNP